MKTLLFLHMTKIYKMAISQRTALEQVNYRASKRQKNNLERPIKTKNQITLT